MVASGAGAAGAATAGVFVSAPGIGSTTGAAAADASLGAAAELFGVLVFGVDIAIRRLGYVAGF